MDHSRPRHPKLERLPLLIDLFYGFAIANGLSDAIKSSIVQKSPFQWLFLIVAFLLALGDWLAYHIHVSEIPYRSVIRLLMDLLFPALVYCLLLAPTLLPSAAGLNYVAWIVFAYFVFGTTYGCLLRYERANTDPLLLRVLMGVLTLSGAALALSVALTAQTWRTVMIDSFATAAVAVWAGYNLLLVHRTMKSDEGSGIGQA